MGGWDNRFLGRGSDQEQMEASNGMATGVQQSAASVQMGVTGMGVMGRNLARNFARHGYAVALHNRTASKAVDVARDFGHEGTFIAAPTAEEFVAALERPRRLVIMVNAGAATD